jgi:hypothetical protein
VSRLDHKMHFHQPMVAYLSLRQSRSPTPDGENAGIRPSDGVAVTFRSSSERLKQVSHNVDIWRPDHGSITSRMRTILVDDFFTYPCLQSEEISSIAKNLVEVMQASSKPIYGPRFASIAVPADMGRVEEALVTRTYTLSSYLRSSEDFDRQFAKDPLMFR